MLIFDAYLALHRLGIVDNVKEFSEEYLDDEPGYVHTLIRHGLEPSLEALSALHSYLLILAGELHQRPPFAAEATRIEQLSDAVWAEIHLRLACSA